MEENNPMEVEVINTNQVNIPLESVPANVVPQDNSQQSEKTGKIFKNKGEKSSFVIGLIFVMLVIVVMIALASYDSVIIEKNNLSDGSSSASDYSSVSSSNSNIDNNYDYGNDNADSDNNYDYSYDNDDYDYDYSYNDDDYDYDYSYDNDDYSYNNNYSRGGCGYTYPDGSTCGASVGSHSPLCDYHFNQLNDTYNYVVGRMESLE